MFTNRFHSWCALLLAAVTSFVSLQPVPSASAGEPQYATVALLLPTSAELGAAIVFDGGTSSGGDSIAIEGNAIFGAFSGKTLISVSAKYVGRGGVAELAVWGFNGALPPSHGVMPLSNAVVEYSGFVYLDGSTLRAESVPEYATYLLVIVTGQVH